MGESEGFYWNIKFDPWVEKKQEQLLDSLPPLEELLDTVKRDLCSGAHDPCMKTPVSGFQLCGLLSCYIVSECDELSHMDNIDSGSLTLREPTEEEIMKAVLLKGILDTLTDIPCYETLNVTLSEEGKKQHQAILDRIAKSVNTESTRDGAGDTGAQP